MIRKTAATITLLSLVSTGLAESLWLSKSNSENGMYADRVATNVGDIISIVVNESTSVSRSSSKSSSSNTSVNHSIDSFLYQGSNFGTHNGEKPSIAFKPSDSHNGEGSIKDSNTLTARIAVLVVDRLPNGNLLIEGARKLKVSGEIQYVVLRGIVRSDDVKADNTIMSYDIVNADIQFLGEGDIADAQKKGWLNELLDTVNVL